MLSVNPVSLDAHLDQILCRLQECVFSNAKFTCRLFDSMATMKTMETAFNDAEKLKIVRETFSVHIVLAYFGAPSSQMNLIAHDNMIEVVTQAKKLLSMTPYRLLLSEFSGQSLEEVRKALNFDKKKESLAALKQVYQGLV